MVDKLEADHLQVSVLLDEVEAAAADLTGDDNGEGRARVVVALEALGAALLEHLDFEERSIESTLARMGELGRPRGRAHLRPGPELALAGADRLVEPVLRRRQSASSSTPANSSVGGAIGSSSCAG